MPNIQSGTAQSIIYDQSKYTDYKPWTENYNGATAMMKNGEKPGLPTRGG